MSLNPLISLFISICLLIGIVIGHCYYFLVEVLPNSHNVDIIKTPQFCKDIIDYISVSSTQPNAGIQARDYRNNQNIDANAGNPAPRGAGVGGQQAGGYTWGRGRVLGRNP